MHPVPTCYPSTLLFSWYAALALASATTRLPLPPSSFGFAFIGLLLIVAEVALGDEQLPPLPQHPDYVHGACGGCENAMLPY